MKPTSVRMTRTELSEFDITATQFWNNPAGSWRDGGLCLATRDQYPALYLAPAQTARYKQIQGPSTCRCRVILCSNGHPCAIRSECIHCSTIACCCPKLRAWEPMHAKKCAVAPTIKTAIAARRPALRALRAAHIPGVNACAARRDSSALTSCGCPASVYSSRVTATGVQAQCQRTPRGKAMKRSLDALRVPPSRFHPSPANTHAGAPR